MYKHLLVPTDGSPLSDRAVRDAARLASALGAKLTLVSVTPQEKHLEREPLKMGDLADEATQRKAAAKQVLAAAIAMAAGEGIAADGRVIAHDDVWQGILDVANFSHCDLIAMATRNPGWFEKLLLGSETHAVLAHSTIPVLVYR